MEEDEDSDEGDGIALSLPSSGRQAETFSVPLGVFSQEDDIQTTAGYAMKLWDASDYAIIVSLDCWQDAVCASSLAGSLNCPVLYTQKDSLADVDKQLIAELGVKHVLVIGNSSMVSDEVFNELSGLVEQGAERISSSDASNSSSAIFSYGVKRGLWKSSQLFIVSSNDVEYAQSLAPVAYALKAPILVTQSNGGLDLGLIRMLDTFDALDVYHATSIGVSGTFKDVNRHTIDFFDAVYSDDRAKAVDDSTNNADGEAVNTKVSVPLVQVLTTEDDAMASFEIGVWASTSGILNKENSILFTSSDAVDSAAISAMQGKAGGLSVLVNAETAQDVLNLFDKTQQKTLNIIGCTQHLDSDVRASIEDCLKIEGVTYYDAGWSLENVAKRQVESASGEGMPNYTLEQALQCIDPTNFYFGNSEFYQFAVLSDGYSGSVTAEQLNAIIDRYCAACESSYGVTSKFRGAGEYFIEAAKKWQVNEVYLLCHAALESAWGCSSFAQGSISGCTGYYNFFGISCYDTNPSVGAQYAKSQGWDTVEKAIEGAARWISVGIGSSGGYINANYAQNTLYLMKWNLNSSSLSHEYATGRTWAVSIARLMGNCYDYLDIPMESTGLRFQVPVY